MVLIAKVTALKALARLRRVAFVVGLGSYDNAIQMYVQWLNPGEGLKVGFRTSGHINIASTNVDLLTEPSGQPTYYYYVWLRYPFTLSILTKRAGIYLRYERWVTSTFSTPTNGNWYSYETQEVSLTPTDSLYTIVPTQLTSLI